MSLKNSREVKVIDTIKGSYSLFLGNKQAAIYLNIGISTLCRYKKNKKLINNRFLVSNLKSEKLNWLSRELKLPWLQVRVLPQARVVLEW